MPWKGCWNAFLTACAADAVCASLPLLAYILFQVGLMCWVDAIWKWFVYGVISGAIVLVGSLMTLACLGCMLDSITHLIDDTTCCDGLFRGSFVVFATRGLVCERVQDRFWDSSADPAAAATELEPPDADDHALNVTVAGVASVELEARSEA